MEGLTWQTIKPDVNDDFKKQLRVPSDSVVDCTPVEFDAEEPHKFLKSMQRLEGFGVFREVPINKVSK